MTDVLAIGELLIDFASTGVNLEGYPLMEANPGGAPFNFLGALAKYGCRPSIISKVGNDTFGELLIGTLKKYGVDSSNVAVESAAFTTLAFVTLDKHGEREFAFSRKPGADTLIRADELPVELIKKTPYFHFGTLSLTNEPGKSATIKAVELAREAGATISFDPNLRKPLWDDLGMARKQMLWGLERADIVKIGSDELEFVFGEACEKNAKRLIEEFGVKLAFITMGRDGCYFRSHRACGSVPAYLSEKTIDTTGAGDIFGGAALSRVIRSHRELSELGEAELTEIARFASAAAGLSTERHGGIPSIPEEAEVTALLERRV